MPPKSTLPNSIFFIDGEITMDMVKSFIKDICFPINKLTIVINSEGGDLDASELMSYWIISNTNNIKDIEIILLGDCQSAAFLFALSLRDIAEFIISDTCIIMTHKARMEREVTNHAKMVSDYLGVKDIKRTKEVLGKFITNTQVSDFEGGLDVFITHEQAIKILKGKPLN